MSKQKGTSHKQKARGRKARYSQKDLVEQAIQIHQAVHPYQGRRAGNELLVIETPGGRAGLPGISVFMT